MNSDHKKPHLKKAERVPESPEFATADAVIRDTDPEALQVESIEEQVHSHHTGSLDAVNAHPTQGKDTPVEDRPHAQRLGKSSSTEHSSTSHTAKTAPSANTPSNARSAGSARTPASVSDADPELLAQTTRSPSPHPTRPSEKSKKKTKRTDSSPINGANRSTTPVEEPPKSTKKRFKGTKKKQQQNAEQASSTPSASSGTPPRFSAKRAVERPQDGNATVVGSKGALASLKEILFKEQTQSVPITKPEDKIDRILTMMRVLGIALLQSHQATTDVSNMLRRIAVAYNMPPVRVVTLPTMLVIQVEGTDRRTEFGSVEDDSLRLDQTDAIESVVEKATRGVIEPDDAIAQIERTVASPPRYNWFMRLLGQVIMTLAIGLLINPVFPAIPAYIILGFIVGLMMLVGERFSTLHVAMPVICAAVVTVVSSQFLVGLTNEIPVRLIAPALVTFLPGLTLTLAALELTRNEVIGGSSRLIYGLSQLLLLAFGVVIGMNIGPAIAPTNEIVLNTIGPWTPLLGIALLALGYVLARSAPQGSYLWLVLALCVTYLAQRLGMLIVPSEFSGFFGALVVVPLSRFLVRFKTAPSAVVTQLVSFWILVPGALGFIGFAEAATGSAQTINTLVTVVMALFSIALGMLVGSGLTRDTGSLMRADG